MAQILHPVAEGVQVGIIDREKPCREGLGEFGLHVAGILIDAILRQIDMLEAHGGNRPIPRAGQHQEGKERLVAALQGRGAGHLGEGVAALLWRRVDRVAGRVGNAGVLGVQVEVFGIGIGDARLVTRLPCQPKDECLDHAQGAIDRGLGKCCAGAGVLLVRQMPLEGDGLFNMKPLERLEAGTAFEAKDGLRRLVHRRHVAAFGFTQELQVVALDALVFFMELPGHCASFPK